MFRDCLSRFWDKVDVQGEDECWEWHACTTPRGYGQFVAGRGGRVYAHRFAWEIAHAKQIPEGKHILHSCDNPPCVNPRHLRPGTDADNVADMLARNRHVHGARHHHAKLTDDKVKSLVAAYRAGTPPLHLAQAYGVTDMTIHDIINGVTWTSVTGGPIRQTGRAGTRLTPIERAAVIQLREEGLTQIEIAKRLHRSPAAVRQTLYAAGLGEPRPGRPAKK